MPRIVFSIFVATSVVVAPVVGTALSMGDESLPSERSDAQAGDEGMETMRAGCGDGPLSVGAATVPEDERVGASDEASIEIAVVSAVRTRAAVQTVGALAAQLNDSVTVDHVCATNALSAIGEYDAFVVLTLPSPDAFVEATNHRNVGTVLLDQRGWRANAIPDAAPATGVPNETNDAYGSPPIEYRLKAAHPIVNDVGTVGDNVTIHTADAGAHSWFEAAGDVTVLAKVGDQNRIAGAALAVDEANNTVYASSLGRSIAGPDNGDFTESADAILGAAVEHVSNRSSRTNGSESEQTPARTTVRPV